MQRLEHLGGECRLGGLHLPALFLRQGPEAFEHVIANLATGGEPCPRGWQLATASR